MMKSKIGDQAIEDTKLAVECTRHAQMYFDSKSQDLASACHGTYSIKPTIDMIKSLKKDYKAMSGMIFGDIPLFEEVIDSIKYIDDLINN